MERPFVLSFGDLSGLVVPVWRTRSPLRGRVSVSTSRSSRRPCFALLSHFVRSSLGEVVDEYQTCVADLTPVAGPAGPGDRSAIARRLVLFGLSLRPALLAPATGATLILGAVASLDATCPAIGLVRRAVVGFGEANLELSPSVLKGVRDHAGWATRLRQTCGDARGWLESNRQAKIIYAAATNVWHQWLRDDGPLGRPIQAVVEDRRADQRLVREAVKDWSDSRTLEKQLTRTDEAIRGNGARRRPIEARSRTELSDRVSEFVRLAGNWLEHVSAEPRTLDDYRQRRADLVREEVQKALPHALADVDRLEGSGGVSVILPAAILFARRALEDLRRLFDPSEEVAETPPVRVILGEELLAFPRLDLTDDWRPGRQADVTLLRQLVDLAATPYSPEEAFRVRSEERNHVRTAQVIDAVRARGNPTLADRLQEDRTESVRLCRGSLLQTLASTRAGIERAVCYDLISSDDRNRFSETVEGYAASLDDLLDFARAWDDLRRLDEQIAACHASRILRVRERLNALTAEGVPGDRQGDIEVIRTTLERGDFLSAEGYIELVRTRQPVVRPTESGRQTFPFQEFFPGFVREVNKLLDAVQGPRPRDIADRVRERRSIGPIDMSGVAGPQAVEAAEMIETWLRLKDMRDGRGDVGRELTALLSGLGFREVAIGSVNRWRPQQHWHAVIQVARLSDPAVCIVPQYGSLAGGKYRILGVYDRPDEESLVDLTKEVPGTEPLLVLYFGGMTEQRRRNLAEFCWSRSRQFLTIDECLVYFLCAERFSRLPILFQCALPFTVARPYTTTASLVPVEMFFGRRQERGAGHRPLWNKSGVQGPPTGQVCTLAGCRTS
ncbi:MAG: hypothetical protein U0792_06800 [Gemmataceae bacterium]